MRSIAIIINKRAGTAMELGESGVREAVQRGFAGSDVAPTIELVEPSALHERLRAAFASDCDAVAVGGGDGTIRTAAAMAMQDGKTLGILPLGTLNLLSKDLGIPQDLEEAAAVLGEGRERAIDVGQVNDELFLVKAMIGRINATVRAREKRRSRFNPIAWVKVIWRALRAIFRVSKRGFDLDFGDRRTFVETAMLTVASNRLTGRLGNPFYRARLDAGLLATYRFPELRAGKLVTNLGSRSPVLDSFLIGESKTLTVTTRRPRVYASLDGELSFLHTPLSFRIHEKALKVMGPAR